MPRFIRRLALWALLVPTLGWGADKPKGPAKPAPPPAIAKLGWLAGAWHVEKAGRVVDQQWMAPAGGNMLGMSRTLAKGREVGHEFLQLREGPAGELFFVIQAAGQKEAVYLIKALSDTMATFTNPLIEFPQSITYALQPDGTCKATLEGAGPTGEPKRLEDVYLRAAR